MFRRKQPAEIKDGKKTSRFSSPLVLVLSLASLKSG